MDRRLGDRPSTGKTGTATRRPFGSGVASPFVGRDDELRRLSDALDLVAEGHGGAIFLTGQPGIGKTRLAREALCLAKARRFRVLEGRAYPIEAGLAYAPVLDAFDPLLHHLDPMRLSALVAGLPELGRLFDGLGLPRPEPLGDPALEKTRLHRAVSRLLERLTNEAPLVLFVDDVHWADPATLELLHYLARGLADQPALLLATYSDSALDTCRDLRALVVSLRRAGVAEEIIIPGLGRDAVTELTQGILGAKAPSELLALLDARAYGTPLFVEAFIDALIGSGKLVRDAHGWSIDAQSSPDIPPSIRHLILVRLERLESVDRHVLDLIAIMRDASSHAILRVLLGKDGLDENTLVGALQRLRGSGLVAEGMEESDVVYSITHPLIQEVAYVEQPEMARRRAHMAAIEAIESFSEGRLDDPSAFPGRDLNRLARHYQGAGPEANTSRGLAVLLAAGERSLGLHAYDEAARHFVAALSMIRAGRQPEDRGLRIKGREGRLSTLNPLSSTLATLLEHMGEACEQTGRHEAAIEVWNEALAERERAGDAVAVSRLRRKLALVECNCGHFDIAEGHLRAGLAALAGREPCQELADLHYTRFQILSRRGDIVGVGETAAELVSVAERLASPRAEGEANLAASSFHLWRNDVTRAQECAFHALMIGESFPEGPEMAICCRAHVALVATGIRLGDHHHVRHHAELGLAVAQRLGAPNLEIVLRLRLAHADFMRGAWDEALRSNMEAISLASRVRHPRNLAYSLAERAMILALRGDLSGAEACVSEAKMAFGSPSVEGPDDRTVFGFIDFVEAALALQRGQVVRALSIAQGFTSARALSTVVGAGLTLASMPTGLMLLAEAQAAAGQAENALGTARELVGFGPAGTPYLSALAARADGLAWRALGQREAAAECLVRAHKTFSALEMPFEAARSLLEAAEVGGHGSRDGGHEMVVHGLTPIQAAQDSLAVFERLGATLYADRARRFLPDLAVSLLVARRNRSGGIALSERELDVARLVADGLTTTDIAKRLNLSWRTVNAHLGHIYNRLGIGSRAALTRYVVEAGLLSPIQENRCRNR